MPEFAAWRSETYRYLTNNDENKKAKGRKKCVIKQKLKFEDYKHCLDATQTENKINQPEKNKVDLDSLRVNHKEFIKKKLTSKSQKRFRRKKHKVFTEEVGKIALSANNDKRIQSIDLIHTYVYGMNKDPECKKEEIKYKNTVKQYTHD